jgi:hypothetical protein
MLFLKLLYLAKKSLPDWSFMNFMFVWPSLLKGGWAGSSETLQWTFFSPTQIPFTHPKMPIAREGGWRNSPAGKHFPFETQYQTEMLPEWTFTQQMSKPLFGHREKSNLAPDQCEIVAGKAFSCPLGAFSMFSTFLILHSVCCSLFVCDVYWTV